jgi:protocatechuate 3,4-dioxygenase alpha subunit
MTQALGHLKESPSQTAGPYVHVGCVPNFCGINGVFPTDLGACMVRDGAKGERISITGIVYDGAGAPLNDALVEIWQADTDGLYPSPSEQRGVADPNFTGWGRQAANNTTGEWTFETIKPGQVPFFDGRMMAPHITFWIVARGINIGLHTRMYFEDEADANANDPVLARIQQTSRIPTLIATKINPRSHRFDIRLQGDGETVFFDI